MYIEIKLQDNQIETTWSKESIYFTYQHKSDFIYKSIRFLLDYIAFVKNKFQFSTHQLLHHRLQHQTAQTLRSHHPPEPGPQRPEPRRRYTVAQLLIIAPTAFCTCKL